MAGRGRRPRLTAGPGAASFGAHPHALPENKEAIGMSADHDLRRLAHRMVWVPGRVAHGC